MKGIPKPIKQKASEGGRVMRQEREKESLKMKSKCSEHPAGDKISTIDCGY
jgi:hypothetical protein